MILEDFLIKIVTFLLTKVKLEIYSFKLYEQVRAMDDMNEFG